MAKIAARYLWPSRKPNPLALRSQRGAATLGITLLTAVVTTTATLGVRTAGTLLGRATVGIVHAIQHHELTHKLAKTGKKFVAHQVAPAK
jgi:hypothetical protein